MLQGFHHAARDLLLLQVAIANAVDDLFDREVGRALFRCQDALELSADDIASAVITR